MHKKLEDLAGETANEDLKFILYSIAIEVEMNHVSRITSIAQAIADVQDDEVFHPNGIDAPRRNTN